MKKYFYWAVLVLTAAVLGGTAVSQAQDQKEEKPRHEGNATARAPQRQGPPSNEVILKKLTKDLDLSAEQQKTIKDILEKNRPEMEKIAADMKALRERMKKEMFRTKESIRQTLSMDQKEKFDELAARMMQAHERMLGQGEMRGPGMERPGMMGKPGEGEEMRPGPRPEESPEMPSPPHEEEGE
jgi:predicted RNase H-like nuclease (RuvC/YqgF family)